MKIGNIDIADIKLGGSQVSAWFGGVLVWGGGSPTPPGAWLCFTAEQANSTVKFYKYNSGAPTLDIETSTNGQNWSAYTQGTALTAANIGDTIYFRAGSTGNPTVSTYNKTNRFAISGKMAASGDIQYLLSQDGTTQPTADWCFNCLFYGQKALTEPPKCGATTLGTECYGGTFEGCSNLRYAPMLSATNFVGDKPYINMFKNCTSLSSCQEVFPAPTLRTMCYCSMFNGCSSLTAAPALPATTLASGCYDSMFMNCTSLVEAPKLPATTLVGDCYKNLFSGCSALSSIDVGLTSWTNANGTYNWVSNVAASGTFTCPAELSDERGTNRIPTDWNVVHPANIFYNEAPTRVWYNDGTSAEYNIVGQATTSNVLSAAKIEKIEFGNTVTEIVGTIFRNSTNLRYLYTGWNCESLPSRVCNDAKTLSSVVIGPSLKTINSEYAFSGAGPITDLVFHDDCQLSNFGRGAFNVAVSCDVLTIKSRASSINFGHWAFNANSVSESNRRFVNTFIFDVDVIPSLTSDAFNNQGFCRGVAGNYAVVPDNLVAQWKTTSPWSNWASNIISMSEYEAIKNNS